MPKWRTLEDGRKVLIDGHDEPTGEAKASPQYMEERKRHERPATATIRVPVRTPPTVGEKDGLPIIDIRREPSDSPGKLALISHRTHVPQISSSAEPGAPIDAWEQKWVEFTCSDCDWKSGQLPYTAASSKAKSHEKEHGKSIPDHWEMYGSVEAEESQEPSAVSRPPTGHEAKRMDNTEKAMKDFKAEEDALYHAHNEVTMEAKRQLQTELWNSRGDSEIVAAANRRESDVRAKAAEELAEGIRALMKKYGLTTTVRDGEIVTEKVMRNE